MKITKLYRNFSDLILRADDSSAEWVKTPKLRTAWERLLIALLFSVGVNLLVVHSPLAGLLTDVDGGVTIFRISMSALFSLNILFLILLTINYFKYTLIGGRLIKVDNVFTFYLFSILLFGYLYYFLFLCLPNLFTYDASIFKWEPLVGATNSNSWMIRLNMILYASFNSIGSSYSYVRSNSIIVSLFNYLQSLYSFCLVSLLIAGYVNQKTKGLPNK